MEEGTEVAWEMPKVSVASPSRAGSVGVGTTLVLEGPEGRVEMAGGVGDGVTGTEAVS